jgi:hypothetical protein
MKITLITLGEICSRGDCGLRCWCKPTNAVVLRFSKRERIEAVLTCCSVLRAAKLFSAHVQCVRTPRTRE